jgi:hypothetical protein
MVATVVGGPLSAQASSAFAQQPEPMTPSQSTSLDNGTLVAPSPTVWLLADEPDRAAKLYGKRRWSVATPGGRHRELRIPTRIASPMRVTTARVSGRQTLQVPPLHCRTATQNVRQHMICHLHRSAHQYPASWSVPTNWEVSRLPAEPPWLASPTPVALGQNGESAEHRRP